MKVKDLLTELQNCDPEADLGFGMYSGCCGEVDYLEVDTFEVSSFKGMKTTLKDHVEFRFKPMAGYETCRKAGAIYQLIKSWDEKVKPSELTPEEIKELEDNDMDLQEKK